MDARTTPSTTDQNNRQARASLQLGSVAIPAPRYIPARVDIAGYITSGRREGE